MTLFKNTFEKDINLESYCKKSKQILFRRRTGGFGDILMMRMIFEDIKKTYPEFSIHWAIPTKYHSIASHPYVDEIIDYEKINRKNYINSINLSDICIAYESIHKKECLLHRSDIWAKKCGIELKNHNMHLNPNIESIEKMKILMGEVKKFKNGKTIIFCPFSANQAKDLPDFQINFIINFLEKIKINCLVLHDQKDLRLYDKNYPILTVNNFKDVIATHHLADAVISVDTGHLHCAGGLKKPLLGIFGYIDGDIYCKYYDCLLIQKHRKNNNWPCGGPCWNYFNCPIPHDTPQKPCITMITEEEITDKINLLLDKYNI